MPKRYLGKTPQQQILETKRTLDKPMLIRIANLGLNHFKENFDTESWEGVKWVPRKDRLNHPLLQKTRKLYRNIEKEVQANSVRVFIAAPAVKYGEVHNSGFTGVQKVSRKNKSGRRSQRSSFTRNMKIPKRQFIGESKKMDAKANQLVIDTINKILNG